MFHHNKLERLCLLLHVQIRHKFSEVSPGEASEARSERKYRKEKELREGLMGK